VSNKSSKKSSKKKNEEKHDLLYIMNPNCGWCTKADPVVEALRKDGYEITTLDITNPKDAERANEVKTKYSAQCGTPLFLDAETGNSACGFREKDALEKWAKGEKMEEPQPPKPPTQEPPAPKKYKLEYIWTDGNDSKTVRSKIRFATIMAQQNNLLEHIPEWNFDGSSTNQATTENSDCVLKPVRIFPNPMEQRQMPSFFVLCEVYNSDGTPHETNTRTKLKDALESSDSNERLLIGIEQEYIVTDPTTGVPFGWKGYENETPPPQGDYYCGVGLGSSKTRQLADAHAQMAMQCGLLIDGYHPEVMLSQWEYQIGPGRPLEIADQLWISRFLLQKMAERLDMTISYDPKLVDGNWNGSGAHINFSTKYMREEADMAYMNLICASMQDTHDSAIAVYGSGNEKRLTGKYETSSIDKFTWGEGDRSASIRIPVSTIKWKGKGYLEDRRPASNVDPYEALEYLVSAISNINEELLVTT
jgi:glutamine synthetase